MTESTTITSAIKTLNPLLTALESAFWDASSIELKDKIFDLVTCLHAEMNELAKLSISDLDMPYETITPEFSTCCRKLRVLMESVDELFPRSSTAAQLKEALPNAAKLITSCQL